MRKYPDLRYSVWGDEPVPPREEWYQTPPGIPKNNTHNYAEVLPERPRSEEEDESTESEGDYSISSRDPWDRGASVHEDFEDMISDSAEEDYDDDDDRSVASDETKASQETAVRWYQEGYEKDVKRFGMLENAWLLEKNCWRKEELYYQLQDLENEYAVRHHIYRDLLTGNETEEGFAKKKTRSRMRTRLKENRCIGVPTVKGGACRTNRENKKRRWKKVRVDPITEEIVTWKTFKRKHSQLNEQDARRAFKKLKRKKREARTRRYNGEVFTWMECAERWGFYYEMGELASWFNQLEKVDW